MLRQANGSGGAAAADAMRAVFGPAITARVEATYLNIADLINTAQYKLEGQTAHAPWSVAPSATAAPAAATATARIVATTVPASDTLPATPLTQPAASPQPTQQPAAPRSTPTQPPFSLPTAPRSTATAMSARSPMPLSPLPPVVMPALAGEGIWTTAGLPAAGRGGVPPVAKAYLRPDGARPYALATILQVDLRVARLHIVSGVSEPGGSIGHGGSGAIPPGDTQGGRLLAVFNGGFKYADGAYGLMSGGRVYVPAVQGAATIAVTRSGNVIMGTWGLDRRLTPANRALVAWRQNAGLLIDHGHISAHSQDGAAWGLTILNSTYTWRSGIGLTSHGTLLYVAGNSLSAATLAQTLLAAGAVTAMQLDINPFWVRCFTYGRGAQGEVVAWALNPAMAGIGMEYFYGFARDFFYLTRP